MAGFRGIGEVLILRPKPHKNHLKRGGGGNLGSGRSPSGFRGAVKESWGCYGVLGGIGGVKR